MKKRLFEFSCPVCRNSFFMARDTYLIRDPHSVDFQRMKQGTFFRHQCQKCHAIFDLEYPLIYRDGVHRFSLIFSQQAPEGVEGSAVLVKSASQFEQAFSILECGLSLAEILPLQKRLEAKTGWACRLDEWDREKGILWFECGDTMTGIEYDGLRSERKQVK